MTRRILLLALGLLTLEGCGEDQAGLTPNSSSDTCTPNETQPCLCIGNEEPTEGVQVCEKSGDAWTPCECGTTSPELDAEINPPPDPVEDAESLNEDHGRDTTGGDADESDGDAGHEDTSLPLPDAADTVGPGPGDTSDTVDPGPEDATDDSAGNEDPEISLSGFEHELCDEWTGTITTVWTGTHEIDFEFKTDGTYSAYCLFGGECAATYWGSDEDSPLKTWGLISVNEKPEAFGWLYIYFGSDSGTTNYADLRFIQLSDEMQHLEFEMWKGEYGPVLYVLDRL